MSFTDTNIKLVRIKAEDVDPRTSFGRMIYPELLERSAKKFQHAWRAKKDPSLRNLTPEKKHLIRLDFLQVPQDSGYAKEIASIIREHRYNELPFHFVEFKRTLVHALKLNLIDDEEFLTADFLFEGWIMQKELYMTLEKKPAPEHSITKHKLGEEPFKLSEVYEASSKKNGETATSRLTKIIDIEQHAYYAIEIPEKAGSYMLTKMMYAYQGSVIHENYNDHDVKKANTSANFAAEFNHLPSPTRIVIKNKDKYYLLVADGVVE